MFLNRRSIFVCRADSLTFLFSSLNSLAKLKTFPESGMMVLRKGSPCTTILTHGDKEKRSSWQQTESIKHSPNQPLTHTPVVCTVSRVGDGGVLSVFDQPGETGVRVQSDPFPVLSGHVGAAGVEVTQEHHILHTHTHRVMKLPAPVITGTNRPVHLLGSQQTLFCCVAKDAIPAALTLTGPAPPFRVQLYVHLILPRINTAELTNFII